MNPLGIDGDSLEMFSISMWRIWMMIREEFLSRTWGENRKVMEQESYCICRKR